jgi:hypothetical protein
VDRGSAEIVEYAQKHYDDRAARVDYGFIERERQPRRCTTQIRVIRLQTACDTLQIFRRSAVHDIKISSESSSTVYDCRCAINGHNSTPDATSFCGVVSKSITAALPSRSLAQLGASPREFFGESLELLHVPQTLLRGAPEVFSKEREIGILLEGLDEILHARSVARCGARVRAHWPDEWACLSERPTGRSRPDAVIPP